MAVGGAAAAFALVLGPARPGDGAAVVSHATGRGAGRQLPGHRRARDDDRELASVVPKNDSADQGGAARSKTGGGHRQPLRQRDPASGGYSSGAKGRSADEAADR